MNFWDNPWNTLDVHPSMSAICGESAYYNQLFYVKLDGTGKSNQKKTSFHSEQIVILRHIPYFHLFSSKPIQYVPWLPGKNMVYDIWVLDVMDVMDIFTPINGLMTIAQYGLVTIIDQCFDHGTYTKLHQITKICIWVCLKIVYPYTQWLMNVNDHYPY